MSPQSIIACFDRWLWQDQAGPSLLRLPRGVIRLVYAVLRDAFDGFLSLRATSLVYTTLLSLAPLLAISFAVLKGFGVHNQAEPFLRGFLAPLGEQGDEIALRIVSFVDNIQVGVLGAVGVTLLIYSVLALMHKIESAFNQVWNVPSARGFARRVRDYLGILMVGPLFMFLSIAMTAGFRHAELVKKFLGIEFVGDAIDGTLRFVPYVLFALAFTALYMLMPNCKVRFLPAFIAGAVTGVMWKLLGWGFGVFVAGSASYAAIYSAFAALILFIFWIYLGWLVLLVGASISYYLQYPTNQRLPRARMQTSARARERAVLAMVAEAGRRFYAGNPATPHDLVRSLALPSLAVDQLLSSLIAAGILTLTDEKQPKLVPALPFDTLSVSDFLSRYRAAEEEHDPAMLLPRLPLSVRQVTDAAAKAEAAALRTITLKDISLGDGT